MRSFPLSFISVYRLMLFPFCVISTNNFIPLNLLICLHTQNLAFILLLQTHLPLWYLFQNHFIVHISGLELEQTLMTMTPPVSCHNYMLVKLMLRILLFLTQLFRHKFAYVSSFFIISFYSWSSI